MEKQITLSLPETIYQQAEWLGRVTERDTAVVLTDTLEMIWSTIPTEPTDLLPVHTLADDDLLAIAHMKMDELQNERLGQLQAKGKASSLTETERHELLSLLEIYQIGQLRKAAALAEAHQRQLL